MIYTAQKLNREHRHLNRRRGPQETFAVCRAICGLFIVVDCGLDLSREFSSPRMLVRPRKNFECADAPDLWRHRRTNNPPQPLGFQHAVRAVQKAQNSALIYLSRFPPAILPSFSRIKPIEHVTDHSLFVFGQFLRRRKRPSCRQQNLARGTSQVTLTRSQAMALP